MSDETLRGRLRGLAEALHAAASMSKDLKIDSEVAATSFHDLARLQRKYLLELAWAIRSQRVGRDELTVIRRVIQQVLSSRSLDAVLAVHALLTGPSFGEGANAVVAVRGGLGDVKVDTRQDVRLLVEMAALIERGEITEAELALQEARRTMRRRIE